MSIREKAQPETKSTSTAIERFGGAAVLFVLGLLAGASGVAALVTGRLEERGARSDPLRSWELHGVAAYAGGFFLLLVGATMILLALTGLRFKRALAAFLAADLLAFVAAIVARLAF